MLNWCIHAVVCPHAMEPVYTHDHKHVCGTSCGWLWQNRSETYRSFFNGS